MANTFDPELIESTAVVDPHTVDVYKTGGGTVGKAYTGYWGYCITRRGRVVASGEDLHTGMPKTHEQVVDIVLHILT